MSPWLWSDVIFSRTSIGARYEKSLKVAHTFTDRVVKWQREKSSMMDFNAVKSKRLAFLDRMLKASDEAGGTLSDKDIRDEVRLQFQTLTNLRP